MLSVPWIPTIYSVVHIALNDQDMFTARIRQIGETQIIAVRTAATVIGTIIQKMVLISEVIGIMMPNQQNVMDGDIAIMIMIGKEKMIHLN